MQISQQITFRTASKSAVILFACLMLASFASASTDYFTLQFVDSETGRGIPLVEIETTNRIRYISDSAGRIAIRPGALGSEIIFFHVRSHGYEMQKSEQKTHGFSVALQPGKARTVTLNRVNIAERLYRVTGEGIYYDSQITGANTPLPYQARPKGGVFGQDSVVNAIYNDKLYWFWGDTNRGDSPLGNFKVSGAVSPLPGNTHYDPADAIDLTYFIGQDGFVRQMCPLKSGGLVWINGLMVVQEGHRETMLCGYARMVDGIEPQEIGIAKWNDAKEIFEKIIEFPLDTPLTPRGHPIYIVADGEEWFYFGQSIPDIRVPANLSALLDLSKYQGYTCLQPGSRWNDDSPPLERDNNGNLVWAWKSSTDLITPQRWAMLEEKGLVHDGDDEYLFIDSTTGARVIPHSGSLSWNEYRERWILIFGEFRGSNSVLGEVWYAEALHPEGPWSEARKIVTHDRYSFYNVKQHPYFAKGKYVYFEGTYTRLFSGNDQATPRYDYNQIMYRLNLDDPRLPYTSSPRVHPFERIPDRDPLEGGAKFE